MFDGHRANLARTIQSSSWPLRLWCAAFLLESLVFVGLLLVGHTTFVEFATVADTSAYADVGLAFAKTGELSASDRTLGYPAFIAIAYLIGGGGGWIHVVIAIQLVANLMFLTGVWRLVGRIAPSFSVWLRLALSSVFFVAGLGLALSVMTDFLAGFFFFTFLYGVLFWRTPPKCFIAALAVALATLIRPTFTGLPLLIPVVGWLVPRITSRVPTYQLVVYAFSSLLATGASVAYQKANYGYSGPSSVVSYNIMVTLHRAGVYGNVSWPDFVAGHQKRVGALMGVPYGELSVSEVEGASRRILLDNLRSNPVQLGAHFAKTFVRYLFVPVEHALNRVSTVASKREFYFRYVRPPLFVVFLPLWILAIVPPRLASRSHRSYYLLVMLWVVYLITVSLIAPSQGERIRFPVLPFLLPLALLNSRSVINWYRGLRLRRG